MTKKEFWEGDDVMDIPTDQIIINSGGTNSEDDLFWSGRNAITRQVFMVT
jgi:hypothetical protein